MCRKVLLTILIVVALLAAVYLLRAARLQKTTFETIPFATKYDFQQVTPEPLEPDPAVVKMKQTAWIPDWDMVKGIASFRQVASTLDSISPVWYYYEANGVREAKKGLDELVSVARENNVKVIPSIASFDRDHLHEIFKDDESALAHAEYLLSEVEKNDFDGIDIDYESIHFPDQPEYFIFLRKLYEELDKQGKILSVTVLPKWSDQLVTSSLAETRKVQDWNEISEMAHEVRIMAYEATTPTNTNPGPIAPLPWIEAILKYALVRIPREKIILGVHLYGYDGWTNNTTYTTPYLINGNTFQPKLQANPITYDIMPARLAKAKKQYLDPETKEQVLIYTGVNGDNIVFYQDAVSMQYRIDIAQKYGVAGIGYWRMGREDINVYNLIK